VGLVAKLSVLVKRAFPERFLRELDRKLESTKVALAAEEYVSTAILLTLVICVALGATGLFIRFPIPTVLLVPMAGAVLFPALVVWVPKHLAAKRAEELERVLPDALRQMAGTLRAGVSVDGALEDIAKSKYGELSKEFERVVVEVKRGRTLEGALLAMARRSHSPLYQRAFNLIVEGIERGAALANVLEAVSNDIKEVHAIQRERKAMTTQQVMFLYAVALFACPFIVGLVIGVGGIKIGGPEVATAGGLPPEMGIIGMGYIAIQAFICGLAVGTIKFGKMSKGIGYSIAFMIASVIVFNLAQMIIAGMAPPVG
jgi:pilus assembly protein TadC